MKLCILVKMDDLVKVKDSHPEESLLDAKPDRKTFRVFQKEEAASGAFPKAASLRYCVSSINGTREQICDRRDAV